jgi:hypothetical protein
MQSNAIARIRRTLYTLAAGAVVWSMLVALTGGVYFRISGWRVSSRDYRDALTIAFLLTLTAIVLARRVGGWAILRAEYSWVTDRINALTAPVRRYAPWLPIAPTLVILALSALAIRQWAYAPPLWFDEEAILLNVRDRSSAHLGGSLWLGQSAPLGWLLIERGALVALGSGELALRLVPLIFGVATTVAALWIGRRWMTPLGCAVTVLLFTFGPLVSHYTFEAKHYSADTFWATLLPALAAWAIEGADKPTRIRRLLVWWLTASCGQMLSNGAVLVAPGCALFLAAYVIRREDRRATGLFLLGGFVWLAAFGLHYQLALRATHESEYLRNYWAAEMPPAEMGVVDRVRWVSSRFADVALNPVGTEWSLSVWTCGAVGLVLGGRRALGLAFATVPLSAFALSAAGVVPLYQRFVLWVVPAMYVGLALTVDRTARVIHDAYRQRRWAATALPAVALITTAVVCRDIHRRGRAEMVERTGEHKHRLDDRAAGRWLMEQLRPGDAVLTTRLAWPALWWYGNVSIAATDAEGVVRHPAGIPLLEVDYVEPGPECTDGRFQKELRNYRRVLVYVGIETTPGFGHLLLHALDEVGEIEAFREFSSRGRGAIIDPHHPAAHELTLPTVSPTIAGNSVTLHGCARIGPAKRW